MEDFTIMTDSSANLTPDLVQEAQIEVIPLTCLTDAGEIRGEGFLDYSHEELG